jgi:hypothetical protein
VKVRHEGCSVLGGILGLPHTFAGILVGQRVGRRLLLTGVVKLEVETAANTNTVHPFQWANGVATAVAGRAVSNADFPSMRKRGRRVAAPHLLHRLLGAPLIGQGAASYSASGIGGGDTR